MNNSDMTLLIKRMKKIQMIFFKEQGVNDIWSNSKVYEILIANSLNHNLIPGHSGSRDAININMVEYEYKHYKELSSNHSWTFNDFSDNTINKLIENEYSIIFAHINDTKFPPQFDWYFDIKGRDIGNYLFHATKKIRNNRKMINVSPNQIHSNIGYKKKFIDYNSNQKYKNYLDEIFSITRELEDLTGVKNSLTSNKFWEIFIASHLGHKVNSEQGGRRGAHDAYNDEGESFEYKVSKNHSWNFQDISEEVLNKYYDDKEIILAVVDKENFLVTHIYSAEPKYAVPFIEKKLKDKIAKNQKLNKSLRRKQISLSKGDLCHINAKTIKLN